jgi:hypothetical protein
MILLRLLAVASLGQGVASAQLLDVPKIGQAGTQWCWAASAEMIHDYCRPEAARAVGQCTLAHGILCGCKCREPGGYDVSAECDVGTPFTTPFLPKILEDYRLSVEQTPEGQALTAGSLACQIQTLKSPVAFWWNYGLNCDDGPGHIAVAMGWHVTAEGSSLVAVLDPLPVGEGDRYWVTYQGFACGSDGAHCTDYFSFSGSSCSPLLTSIEDCSRSAKPYCRLGMFGEPSEALEQVKTWLTGPDERDVRSHLRLSESAKLNFRCQDGLELLEAVPTKASKRLETRQTRRSRILCTVSDGAASRHISFQLYNVNHRYSVARIGQEHLTSKLIEALKPWYPEILSEDARPAEELRIEEVFLAGHSTTLLIDRSDPEAGRVVVVGETEFKRYDLETVLGHVLEGGSGTTLRQWIDRTAPP